MDDDLQVVEAGEALLLGVLPLFTSALVQESSTVKSSYFENFCTLFSAEAQLLETCGSHLLTISPSVLFRVQALEQCPTVTGTFYTVK